jgi:hypothetical protein
MTLPAYDIFKKDAAAEMIWVEAVEDLESAKMRVRELSRDGNSEYAIFNQHTRQIVFEVGRLANCRQALLEVTLVSIYLSTMA